jgi:hypothetical protein
MPAEKITKNTDLAQYSDEIRNLNLEKIENLPADQQQDAISKVLQKIAEIRAEEINAIKKMKTESLTKNGGTTKANWINYGDVLVTLEAEPFSYLGIKWNFGHSGIAGFDTKQVIQARPDTGVHKVNDYNTYYGKRNTDELYIIGAPDTKYKNAVTYALGKVSRPYALKTTLSDTSKWYCSKLVYKAWESQGYKLKNAGMSGIDQLIGLVGVTPKQILYDNDVAWYQKVPKTGH